MDLSRGGMALRFGRRTRRAGLAAIVLAALQAGPAAALPETDTPTLSLARTIRTNPFEDTSSSLKDGEGSAFVPNNLSHPNKDGTDSLWLTDDSGDSAWEVNPFTGALKTQIAPADWQNTPRLGCPSCAAGTNRAEDLESAAYDAANDILYVFNGPCCNSSVLPTAFRLTRRADGSFYPESFQPLPSGTDFTAAGWNPGDGLIYVGKGKDLRTYDYLTNSIGPAFQVSGLTRILGMTFSNGDLFVVTSSEKLFRVDWPTKTLRPGWTFDLTPFDILDSRAVEVIADPSTRKDQFYVLDGYSRSSGDPLKMAVFVLDVCCQAGPIASFAWAQTPGTTTVQFNDTSTGGPTIWEWDFGDGTTSTEQSPSHTYFASGNYTVTLTASSNDGSSTATKTVTVPPSPVASFTWAQQAGTTAVQFTDTSTGGPTSWEWDFGDERAPSTEQNPLYTYASPGTYVVTLNASNATGSSDRFEIITVDPPPPPPPPDASFTWAQTDGTTTVEFTDTSTGGPTTWEWDFGDATPTSFQQNPSHTYASGESYTVTLTATNDSGSDTAVHEVPVTDPPPPPQVMTFGPTADSYVEQTEPARNFGTKLSMAGKLRSGNEKRPYLTFDVSGLQGGTITGATLRLFVNDASTNGGDWYTVSPNWTETGITWNNAPPISGASFGSIPTAPVGTWVEVDLTGVVTQEGMHSFAGKGFNGDTVYYASKESANPPELVVDLSTGPDTTPPTVTSVSPADGATGVALSTKVDVTFSEAMDMATAEGAFSLVDPTQTPVGGAFSWSGNTMRFTPSSPLSETTIYTAVVGTGAQDPAGNALEAEKSWSFTTGAAPSPGDPVIAAAGDIACDTSTPGTSSCRHEATSDLLVGAGLAAVLPLGDLQYENGELANFNAYYDPTWGRVKDISYPVPGNREYNTSGASGYYTYWQDRPFTASPGYYSFDIGSWHVIALNSECSAVGGCGAGSPQEQWLRADLAAHPAASCTLAYWHHPRFSSKGNDSAYQPLWEALYDNDAEVVLVGHDHFYERFAPQTPSGTSDPTQGIRQFIVGSGGKSHGSFGTPAANSEAHNDDTYGVLELTLHPGSYDWEFVSEAGGTFTDAGSTSCH